MKRLLLVDEDDIAFLMEAIETWSTVYAGDKAENHQSKVMSRFNVIRHMEGKYTAAEIEEIGQAALDLMD